jgi:hypothetical protein
MVQHAGNPNGVLACSTLGYHVLDTTTNTYYYCSTVGIAGVAEFTVIGPHKYDAHSVYVDAVNGSDTTGDGKIENPYQTIGYACSQVPAPTDFWSFGMPVVIHVATGYYDETGGTIQIPQRLHVVIALSEAWVEGDIAWNIDPQLWFDYGMDPAVYYPKLTISNPNNRRDGYGYFSSLSGGRLTASNANTGTGKPMPTRHILSIDGVKRDTFQIHNEAAGTGVQNDATGIMQLYLRNSPGQKSRIGGMADLSVGVGFIEPNEVEVWAEDSDLSLVGTCLIEEIRNCDYEADYTKDIDNVAYLYGRMQGNSVRTNIIQSRQVKKFGSLFGFNPAAPDNPHTTAVAIVFDRYSLSHMAQTTSTMATAFAGFKTSHQMSAYGRGWVFDECWFDTAALTIPNNGIGRGQWRLFAHAYAYAQYQLPNGLALAASNRYTIFLEPGQYKFEADLTFQANYVDVVGAGEVPSVEFYLDTRELKWEPTDAAFQNVKITQRGDVADRYCMRMDSVASSCVFKNLVFAQHPSSVWDVRAVPINAGVGPVGGTWSDCTTTLERFLYGGSIAPQRMSRCFAGNRSFGAWEGPGTKDLTVSGFFEDCVGRQGCFASTTAGGNVVLSGTLNRCAIDGYGFAHTSGGAGHTADCNATMTDCDNKVVGGGYSFGYSATGQGRTNGVFIRCNSSKKSFGCSESNAGGDYGWFTGQAIECQAGENSFGCNSMNLAQSRCQGALVDCIASYQSFGARGEFLAQATRCKGRYGSFGNQTTFAKSLMDSCEVADIAAAANQGPPGIFGARVRNCKFFVRAGQLVAPLWINGGLEPAGQESLIENTDLFTDSYGWAVEAVGGGPFDIQMAHCRMNKILDPALTNVLAVPYNVIEAKYDPTI